AEDDPEERGLAGAVRADEADAVAARDDQIQVSYERAATVALADLGKLANQLARARACADGEPDVARALAPRRALLAQALEPPHAAFVARAARPHAFPDPGFLLRP